MIVIKITQELPKRLGNERLKMLTNISEMLDNTAQRLEGTYTDASSIDIEFCIRESGWWFEAEVNIEYQIGDDVLRKGRQITFSRKGDDMTKVDVDLISYPQIEEWSIHTNSD